MRLNDRHLVTSDLIAIEHRGRTIAIDAAAPVRETATAREARIVAGFEEVQRFTEVHGHAPRTGDVGDIFERLYAVRLRRLRALPEAQTLLAPLDRQGLLQADDRLPAAAAPDNDEALLAALLGDAPAAAPDAVTTLRHVRSRAEIQAAEEIANREPCPDFAHFKPIFDRIRADLKVRTRVALPFGGDGSIALGNAFILGGQLAYVAEVGETIKTPAGENDARLRVIYANGAQSNLLLQSLQRALYKDEAGRRISEPDPGPLFRSEWQEGAATSGIIYVLRSLSDIPFVAQHRDLVHKIGVTGEDVQRRIAQARRDTTYLHAEVEVVAEYRPANINRTKLETLLHRIFAAARLEIEIPDGYGDRVQPREWFLVPLEAIDEAVARIRDGPITQYVYDPKQARLVAATTPHV